MILEQETSESGDVEFGTDVMNFWGLKDDPISPSPLNFKIPVHFDYFVKTRTINAVNDVKRQFMNGTESRILLLLGSRGTGKTTAMKYLSSLVNKESTEIAFIDCPIRADKDDFKKSVHLSIYKGMRNFLLKSKKLTGEEINRLHSPISKLDVSEIEDQMEILLDIICSSYPKRMIFLDNLDKTTAGNLFEIVHGYFKSQQAVYENLLDYDNIYVFISLLPIFKDLLTDPEVNFLAGKVIKVRTWTESELNDLLGKRLKMAFTRKEAFRLDNFFTKQTLRLIYVANEYNPRWSLLAIKKLMKRYYEVYSNRKAKLDSEINDKNNEKSKEIVDVNKKPLINEAFCRFYHREIQGVRGTPAVKIDFETLDVQARNRFKNAYDKTKIMIEQFKDFRLEIIETMISIYSHDDILEDQLSLNKLSESGFVQVSHGRYEFTPDVLKLFNFLYDNVHKNLSLLRHYLLQFLI